jgi:hypothetical protein
VREGCHRTAASPDDRVVTLASRNTPWQQGKRGQEWLCLVKIESGKGGPGYQRAAPRARDRPT